MTPAPIVRVYENTRVTLKRNFEGTSSFRVYGSRPAHPRRYRRTRAGQWLVDTYFYVRWALVRP